MTDQIDTPVLDETEPFVTDPIRATVFVVAASATAIFGARKLRDVVRSRKEAKETDARNSEFMDRLKAETAQK